MIKNDKCKQSEVLAFLVQNLGLLCNICHFSQIDWSLLFRTVYKQNAGMLEKLQKKTLIFLIIICMRYLGYILGLITGPDQTSPTLSKACAASSRSAFLLVQTRRIQPNCWPIVVNSNVYQEQQNAIAAEFFSMNQTLWHRNQNLRSSANRVGIG